MNNKPQPKSADLQPPRPEVSPGQGGPVRTPNCNDVLSGRGGRINSHSGNVHFREMVESLKRDYLDPRTKKLEKARIAARLVATIRRLDPPGKFLKEDPHTGMWVEIGDERAWKKAGQALRESAPEIRAEHQAKQLQAAVVASTMGSQAKSASSNGSGGRQADPPGPRHRPNPPEREGLARSRAAYEQQQFQTNQQDLQDDDLELNQLRREYMKMKRMQQEQQARMQQFQQNQGNFFDNNSQSQMSYSQQSYLDDSARSANSGAFSATSSQGSQQMLQMQQMQQLQQLQQQYMNLQNYQANLNYQQQRPAAAFESQFNSCDKTVSSVSTFDVHSMDMSSLGGYSSYAGNQSQNLSFAGNLSQGMSMNSMGSAAGMSGEGKNSASRKSALERKLEKVNEAHRRQCAAQYQQQQQQPIPQQAVQKIVVPTHKESKKSKNVREQNMQSIGSLGFEAIDEDEVTEASCKLSNLGFSEMDMTFNSDILSIRSKNATEFRTNERPPESEAKQSGRKKAPVTASSIFDQSLGADSLQSSFNKSSISVRKGGFNNSNISMDDFNESFKSMDMEDNRGGPIDPDGHLPFSGRSEKMKAASSPPRRGRQREPAGGRLPSIQSGFRSSGAAATDTGVAEAAPAPSRNSMGSLGMGLSNNTFGLSDPLLGDFGVSMNSIRSFQSQGSDSSSWLKQYESMENIGNEKVWDDECGSASSSMSEISAPRMVTTCGD